MGVVSLSPLFSLVRKGIKEMVVNTKLSKKLKRTIGVRMKEVPVVRRRRASYNYLLQSYATSVSQN